MFLMSKAADLLQKLKTLENLCDPCVGSGILRLAHAACHPLWLAQIGSVQD
jgi:hypothetical protein